MLKLVYNVFGASIQTILNILFVIFLPFFFTIEEFSNFTRVIFISSVLVVFFSLGLEQVLLSTYRANIKRILFMFALSQIILLIFTIYFFEMLPNEISKLKIEIYLTTSFSLFAFNMMNTLRSHQKESLVNIVSISSFIFTIIIISIIYLFKFRISITYLPFIFPLLCASKLIIILLWNNFESIENFSSSSLLVASILNMMMLIGISFDRSLSSTIFSDLHLSIFYFNSSIAIFGSILLENLLKVYLPKFEFISNEVKKHILSNVLVISTYSSFFVCLILTIINQFFYQFPLFNLKIAVLIIVSKNILFSFGPTKHLIVTNHKTKLLLSSIIMNLLLLSGYFSLKPSSVEELCLVIFCFGLIGSITIKLLINNLISSALNSFTLVIIVNSMGFLLAYFANNQIYLIIYCSIISILFSLALKDFILYSKKNISKI